MARRRFQHGSLELRGDSWTSRWTERVIVNGEIVERHPSRVLGTKKDYPTRKLALRAHSNWIDSLGINNLSYRPKPVASFLEFAEKWKKSVLPNLKPSAQPPIRSQLRKHLVPRLGAVAMKDISGELLQSFVTDCSSLSPKSVKNLVATLRIMWNQAKAWGYIDRDPFATLVLPEWEEAEQPSFSVDEIRRIIQVAKPPYDTVFWLVAQTGIRRGEVCALNIGDVNLDSCVITVRRSRSGKHITNTKSKRPRVFPISQRLAMRLRTLVVGRPHADPLFLTAEGKRLHPDNFVKRHLTPILDALGIPRAGLHAFRHGNATAQDSLAVPLKTRQERLGHVNTRTTMEYTHLLGEDGRRVPVQLDDLFCPEATEVLVQDGRVM